MGVACSDSVNHNQVQVLRIPVLLLAYSQDWTCNLQMIVSLEALGTNAYNRYAMCSVGHKCVLLDINGYSKLNYIYIYIYRERERERNNLNWMNVYSPLSVSLITVSFMSLKNTIIRWYLFSSDDCIFLSTRNWR